VTRGPDSAITLDVGELNATLFEALYRDASAAVRAERWHQAADVTGRVLGLWRGDVLADVDSRVLREECAGRLEQLRVQATEWQVEARCTWAATRSWSRSCATLAQRYPLREHIHGQLMLALYRCGPQAEALDAYQDARKVLIEEVGVEPGAPLRDLHRQNLLWAAGKLADYATGLGLGLGLGLDLVPEVVLHPSVAERFTRYTPGLSPVAADTADEPAVRRSAGGAAPVSGGAAAARERRPKAPYSPAQVAGISHWRTSSPAWRGGCARPGWSAPEPTPG
jgi:hypothetical protein